MHQKCAQRTGSSIPSRRGLRAVATSRALAANDGQPADVGSVKLFDCVRALWAFMSSNGRTPRDIDASVAPRRPLLTRGLRGPLRHGSRRAIAGASPLPSTPRCLIRIVCVRFHSLQLFYSFFKTLVGKEIVVELKNGVQSANNKSGSCACLASAVRPYVSSPADRKRTILCLASTQILPFVARCTR